MQCNINILDVEIGFYKLAALGIKGSFMDKTAERRYEILLFWEKHGLEATVDAYKMGRRTLYGWRKRWKESEPLCALTVERQELSENGPGLKRR